MIVKSLRDSSTPFRPSGDSEKVRRTSSIVRPLFGDIGDHVERIAHNLRFATVRWNSDHDWQLKDQEGPLVVKREKIIDVYSQCWEHPV